MLRGIFGRNRETIIGLFRKFHDELLDLLLLAKYYYDYQIEEDEMGRACSTHGREEECVERFGRKP
jgi:hypothetical protein